MKGNACRYVRSGTSSLLEFIRSLGAVIGATDREREAPSDQKKEADDIASGVAVRTRGDGKRNS